MFIKQFLRPTIFDRDNPQTWRHGKNFVQLITVVELRHTSFPQRLDDPTDQAVGLHPRSPSVVGAVGIKPQAR